MKTELKWQINDVHRELDSQVRDAHRELKWQIVDVAGQVDQLDREMKRGFNLLSRQISDEAQSLSTLVERCLAAVSELTGAQKESVESG